MTDRAFAERYGPWAVVAGATGGVGAAIATALAARGVGVVAVARGADALERTARRLAGDHGVPVRTVAVDLADRRAADRILDEAAGLDVGTLVYATGSSLGEGRAWEQPAEHDRMLVERNCVTPLSLARGIAPRLLARGRGAIVLLSSGAGLRGSPGVAVYSATKAFDIVLAECLWAELRPHGVDVLAPVLPFVDSESMRELMVRRGLREAGDGAPLPGALDVHLPVVRGDPDASTEAAHAVLVACRVRLEHEGRVGLPRRAVRRLDGAVVHAEDVVDQAVLDPPAQPGLVAAHASMVHPIPGQGKI